jgi:hypothetical protein
MDYLVDTKKRKPKAPEFIVLNELAQVFCGLIGGYPEFSDNFDSAKPLNNLEQVRMIQQGTLFKLEIEYIS